MPKPKTKQSTPKPVLADDNKISTQPIHDLQHQISLVREAMRSEKRRLGFFLGAGCPLGIYNEEGNQSIKHMPDVAGLTAAIATKLCSNQQHSACWAKLIASCKTTHCPTPNVEHILTQLRTICALRGATTVDGMSIENLKKLDNAICDEIVALVGKALPKHINAYHRFAAWVRHLERTYPLEIFTPNYDLLLEEALEQYRVPFFDGFIGSREPFFDLGAMEQDKVPERWVRLWKLHGSINWIKKNDESVFRCHPAGAGAHVMIYPSHQKYEQSRRLPYLAMCDRLKAFFREVNPVIIICGYSFADEHINELIFDGLRANRSAHCFALMYSSLSHYKDAIAGARKLSNLTVLCHDGAVVATRVGAYLPTRDPQSITSGLGITIEIQPPDSEGDQVWLTQSSLGDFHHLGLFMETQFGSRSFD